jgi:hypothetical protein
LAPAPADWPQRRRFAPPAIPREKFNLHRNLLANRGLDAGAGASPFGLTVSDLTYTSL